MAPSRSAHVQLGDVLDFLIQQDGEVVDEFQQHDGVVTVMVMLSPQGFAQALRKYDRGTELWRGAPHTAKTMLCLVWGAPSPLFIYV